MLIRTASLLMLMANSPAAEEDFYKSLMALTTSATKVPRTLREKLESQQYDPVESLGGVKLGMTMNEVVKVWGKPNFIWMQQHPAGIIVLETKGCTFTFKHDKLVGIGIHSAALPGLKLKNGITFKSTLTDVKQKYPSGSQSEFAAAGIKMGGPYSVELQSGHTLDFTFIGNDNKLIAIEVKLED